MFGLLVTTEAHFAFSGAIIHSNNTAEMTAMIEALSFLGPRGPVARDEQSCVYYDSMHVAGICLGTIQARIHVQLALACQQSLIHAQRRLRLTMQHVFGHSGNFGNECADHAAALGTFGLISSHNIATVRSWNDCSTFEQMQHHFLKIEVSVGFSHRVHRVLVQFTSIEVVCCSCSQVFPSVFLCPQRVMDRLSSSASTVPSIDDHFEHNILSPPISSKSTWPRSHSLVTLLLIYYVTRKRYLHLHDDALGTTTHGVSFDSVAPLPPSRRCVWRVAATLWFTFIYFLLLVLFSLVYFRIHTICHKGDTLCSFG